MNLTVRFIARFHRWLPLSLFLLVASFAALVSSIATATGLTRGYSTLQHPAWSSPAWSFGPVSAMVYLLMAIATWRVWRLAAPRDARRTFAWFAALLSGHVLWSMAFFGLQRPGVALAVAVALWLALVAVLVRFWRADRVAGLLWLLPVAWVGFTLAFNAAIWRLN